MNPDPYLYSRYNNGPRKWARETLDDFEPICQRQRHVVDIGCATGEVTKLLADKFPSAKVVAVDKVEEMLDFAKVHNKHDRVQYHTADIQNKNDMLDEWTSRFDLVFSFLCLQWVEDQRSALLNINRLLRNGGECLIALGTKPSESFMRLSREVREHSRWKPYLEDFFANQWNTSTNGLIRWRVPDPIRGYSNLLRESGFRILSACPREYEYSPETEAKCKGMLEILMPQIRAIPEKLRPEFMDDALEIFMSFCPKNENGLSEWRPSLLLFHCVKDDAARESDSD